MKKLYRIIAGINKPCKIIEEIKAFQDIPHEIKNTFVGMEPVFYEDINGAIYTTEKKNIVLCDIENATGRIGGCYKVPNEHITNIA